MIRRLMALLILAAAAAAATAAQAPAPVRKDVRLPPGVPSRVGRVLESVDDHGSAPDGYQGGRTFLNIERQLPQTDRRGRRVRYREWDVHPLRPGYNRGPERLVTGSDGSAYYTDDHYRTFKKIR